MLSEITHYSNNGVEGKIKGYIQFGNRTLAVTRVATSNIDRTYFWTADAFYYIEPVNAFEELFKKVPSLKIKPRVQQSLLFKV